MRQIVDAIAEVVSARTLKHELLILEAREDFLISQLAASPEQKVLHPPATADQEEQGDAVTGYAVRRAAMAPASASQPEVWPIAVTASMAGGFGSVAPARMAQSSSWRAAQPKPSAAAARCA